LDDVNFPRRMSLVRVFKRAGLGLGLVAGLVLVLQCLWFAYAWNLPQPELRAALLAVYGGKPERYESAWDVERRGTFQAMVFSDASPGFVSEMVLKNGPPRHARLLLEPRARTTAQNARYVAALIGSNRLHSVLVLTSWWHVPRALLLTRLASGGTGVKVTAMACDGGPQRQWNDPDVWLEFFRMWGSLVTYGSDTRSTYGLPRALLSGAL